MSERLHGNDSAAESFCQGGGCVEVVPVENRAGEQEYLVRSDRSDAPKSDVEIFSQKGFNVLATEAATAPTFTDTAFTRVSETRSHLNSAGIPAGERPVFTASEVRGAADRITSAARPMTKTR